MKITIECDPRTLWDCVEWYVAELEIDMKEEREAEGTVNPDVLKGYEELIRVKRQLENLMENRG